MPAKPLPRDPNFTPKCAICCVQTININGSALRPIMLICGHSCCQGCWMSWEDVDHSKLDCGIECPFCRCPILDRPVVNADGVGISAGTSEISVVIDPVHPDGEDDHITMSCTPLTTAQSIIDHVDPLIEREFPKIPFPKQYLELLVQVWQGKKCISSGTFIRGNTLASIGFRDSYTLRLVRNRIKAPHRLLYARLQKF